MATNQPESSLLVAGSPRTPRARAPAMASAARSPRGAAKLPSLQPSPHLTSESKLAECGGLTSFIAVANLLHTVLDGVTDAEGFANVVAAHSNDHAWLVALGTALRELGSLIEVGAGNAASRQSSLANTAARAAHEHEAALKQCQLERDALRKEIEEHKARVADLKMSLEFVADIQQPGLKAETARTQGKRETLDAELRRVRLLRTALQDELRRTASSRTVRIRQQKEILARRDETVAEKQTHVGVQHRQALNRMQRNIAEERRTHEHDFTTRAEIQKQTLQENSERVVAAEAKAEAQSLRAAHQEARASAAADVLREAQAETKKLRQELARAKMQLQWQSTGHPWPGAAFEVQAAPVDTSAPTSLRSAVPRPAPPQSAPDPPARAPKLRISDVPPSSAA